MPDIIFCVLFSTATGQLFGPPQRLAQPGIE